MIKLSDPAEQLTPPSARITISSPGSYSAYTYQIGGTTYSPAGEVWFQTTDTVTFIGTFAGSPSYVPYEFIWDFGDGTKVKVGRSVPNSFTSATHRYKAVGNYTVVHTIVDNTGYRLSAIKPVFVH